MTSQLGSPSPPRVQNYKTDCFFNKSASPLGLLFHSSPSAPCPEGALSRKPVLEIPVGIMADVDSGLIQPFLGALQACTSVLLTLLYGVISRQAGLLGDTSINQMSGVCVKVFLPALIMVKLGSELSLDIATHYIPIFGTREMNPALQFLKNHLALIQRENLVWALLYILISIGIGYLFTRCLRLPVWVTPALAFNNTSSLPLLLLQTLHATGSLKLIMMPGQSESDCLNRAQSYLLICAVVSNTMSYALGPRMLRPSRKIKRRASVESQNGQADGLMTSGTISLSPL